MEPTQETLDELGVTGNLDKFLDGTISKPVAIPGTYETVEQNPQGVFEILLAPISGVYDSIDIILFIFVLGGCIGVLNYMGAFNSAIAGSVKDYKGKGIHSDCPDYDYYCGRRNNVRTCGRRRSLCIRFWFPSFWRRGMMSSCVSQRSIWDHRSEPCSRRLIRFQ